MYKPNFNPKKLIQNFTKHKDSTEMGLFFCRIHTIINQRGVTSGVHAVESMKKQSCKGWWFVLRGQGILVSLGEGGVCRVISSIRPQKALMSSQHLPHALCSSGEMR